MSYFDNNATTPILPRALDALRQASAEDWFNPSSPYRRSSRTKAKLSQSRDYWAQSLGVDSSDLVFTSGATEANNQVIASASQNHPSDSRILLSGIEHPSVGEPARFWFGDRLELIPNDGHGTVCLDAFVGLLDHAPAPALVCVMAANNESGVIQPWAEVARICRERNLPFHCDATQWIGKMPVDDLRLCSSFCASAHKFGGPKGVGCLVGAHAGNLQIGGSQEGGRRAGTENFPAIEAMTVAWRESLAECGASDERAAWRDRMEEDLQSAIPELRVIGQDANRLWNTSLLLMPKFGNLQWVEKMDALGFEISTGSACSSGSEALSPSARAYSLDPMEAKRLVRVSSFYGHGQRDWLELTDAFVCAYQRLTEESSGSNLISI